MQGRVERSSTRGGGGANIRTAQVFAYMRSHNSYMFRCMLQSWASKEKDVKRALDSPLPLTNV